MDNNSVKRTWTKHGWQTRQLTNEDVRCWEASRKHGCTTSGEFRGQNSEMQLIQDAHNEVMYGSVGLKIDELPAVLRMIVEDSDTWHVIGTKLFKTVDPINQVKEFGIWGSDTSDADADVLAEQPSVSRLFLEDSKVLSTGALTENITDILGGVSDSYEIKESPLGTRVNIDVSSIAITQDLTLLDNTVLEDIENIDTTSDGELVHHQDPRMTCIGMPEISDEMIGKLRGIKEEYSQLLSKTSGDKELEMLKLLYEQALDREFSSVLTTSLNSPYCGHGYSPPRRMYSFIDTPRSSDLTEAAEERKEFFFEMYGEAASCDSMNDLFGPLVRDPKTGKNHRPGGFMGKIRSMYGHDKELAQLWSIFDKTDKDGNVTEQSEFNIQRAAFIRKWRDEERGDEEKLRTAVWAWFDRVAQTIPEVRDENGRITKPSRKYRDSIWRQRRTRALKDLHLTRKQWDSVYEMVGIARQRINGELKKRDETLELLRKHFKRINNLQDLRSYMKWAEKRRFLKKLQFDGWTKKTNGEFALDKDNERIPKLRSEPTYKLKNDKYDGSSKLDRISVYDEWKWRKSCAKKRRFLTDQLVISHELREQVRYTKATELPEQALACTDPRCNCMAIGSPVWCEIEDGKGLLGVPCDGCKEVVWMFEAKPQLKTYEDAVNEG